MDIRFIIQREPIVSCLMNPQKISEENIMYNVQHYNVLIPKEHLCYIQDMCVRKTISKPNGAEPISD